LFYASYMTTHSKDATEERDERGMEEVVKRAGKGNGGKRWRNLIHHFWWKDRRRP